VIRRAVAEDADWIKTLSAHVYADFGDYGTIIPAWMRHPGVLTFVEVDDATQARRGFILVGFYEPPDVAAGSYVADLLAIAVAPEHQRKGIGKNLLQYAVELATAAGQRVPIPELRLTVAHTNTAAQKLFETSGFEVLDSHHGSYDGGQRAIRMRKYLDRG
jgi:ribosomal protein S18 acetylase RimI-like enzyme